MGLLKSIRGDIQAAKDRDPAATSSFEVIFAYPGFHARQLHRIAHGLHRRGLRLPGRLVSHLSRGLTGIEIHPGAEIGDGLFVDHGMGVVIGETSVIGDDCHLYQGVTLGGSSTKRVKRHPTLGNGVIVGAGAKIIGAVNIGDGAKIGAGSVVVTNVPAHATVVGVPGHIVAYADANDETVLKLPDPEWDIIQRLQSRIDELEQRIARLESRDKTAPSPAEDE
jgi:serine O-acetyltransferase